MFVNYFGKRKEETKKKGEEISDISKNCVCYPKYIHSCTIFLSSLDVGNIDDQCREEVPV